MPAVISSVTKIKSSRDDEVWRFTATFDSSYATGGEAIDLSKYLGELYYITPEDTRGYMTVFQTFTKAACVCEVWTGDYDPAADSPFVESDSTENLGSVAMVLLAHGKSW